MGGLGSGNWYSRDKKTVVERCLRLDANRWTREGILGPGVHRAGVWGWTYRSGAMFSVKFVVQTTDASRPVVWLSYWWTWNGTGEPQTADYLVHLTTTRPRFGGLRWWFLCPLAVNGRQCNRRVGKLYLPPAARYFGCRHCHDLTYTSCQESHQYERLFRFLAGLRARTPTP
jgi:hypothetical protein